jgi:hypothetical protein
MRLHLAHPDQVQSTSDLPFERTPAVVCDAVALDPDCETSALCSGLAYHPCECGKHKTGEHLGREAIRYDEHFLANTGRSFGKHFEGTALFTAATTYGGRGRLLACGMHHDQHNQVDPQSLGRG